MNTGRKQLGKMVKPFIKLKDELSSRLKPDSRGVRKGKGESKPAKTSTLVAPVMEHFQHHFVASPSPA